MLLCALTFELRRDRRQDARPEPVKMYPYHRPGPGGLPLGLASNEGLGSAVPTRGGDGPAKTLFFLLARNSGFALRAGDRGMPRIQAAAMVAEVGAPMLVAAARRTD